MVAATTPGMDKGENSPLTIVAWRSARLLRVARSSLGAELQAMSECEEELMFTRHPSCRDDEGLAGGEGHVGHGRQESL